MKALETLRDVARDVRAGLRPAAQQVRAAERALAAWQKRRSRPGQIVIEALLAGAIIGASLMALSWISYDTYVRYHSGQSTSGGTLDGPPDTHSW